MKDAHVVGYIGDSKLTEGVTVSGSGCRPLCVGHATHWLHHTTVKSSVLLKWKLV